MTLAVAEIASALPYGNGNLAASTRYSHFNGIPVSSRSATVETRLVRVEQKAIPAELFQAPAGYQQQPMTLR